MNKQKQTMSRFERIVWGAGLIWALATTGHAAGIYQTELLFTKDGGNTVSNCVVTFTNTYASGMQENFNDLRFFDEVGPLAYHLTDIVPGVSAVVDLKLRVISNGLNRVIMELGDALLDSGTSPEDVYAVYEPMTSTPGGTFYGAANYQEDFGCVQLFPKASNKVGLWTFALPDLGAYYETHCEWRAAEGSSSDNIVFFGGCTDRATQAAGWSEGLDMKGFGFVMAPFLQRWQIRYGGTTYLASIADSGTQDGAWHSIQIRVADRVAEMVHDAIRLGPKTNSVAATNIYYGWGARSGSIAGEFYVRNVQIKKRPDRNVDLTVGESLVDELAPIVQTAADVGPHEFTARWSVVDGATNYLLDVATDKDFTLFLDSYQDCSVGNVTSKSITGLEVDTTYYYRVRAQGDSLSGYSAKIGVVTQPVRPAQAYQKELR